MSSTSPPIVQLIDYQLTEPRSKKTLLRVSLEIRTPQLIGIVGPAASGKGLLLTALSGKLPRGLTASGTLQVRGEERFSVEAPIGPTGLSARGSIFRVLIQPIGNTTAKQNEARLESALRTAGIWHDFQSRLSAVYQDLSLADRLIVLATRALVQDLPYLLLDDTTADLDPYDADRFRKVVTAISKAIPVIWASRAYRRVAPTADYLLVLSKGEVVASGPADDVSICPPQEIENVLEDAVGRSASMGIEGLYHDLLALGSKGERAIHRAVQSLTGQNLPQARDVLEENESTTEQAQKIQNRALGLIARTAPIGRDLRTLYTIIEAATDLKRIADHAVNIAEITLAIGEEPLIKPLIDIPRMAEKAQSMVRRSLDALVRRDIVLASQVSEDDEHVDDLYRELFEELLGFVTDGGDSYRAGQALYLLFVARYLEKVADHAKGIANHVIFMVKGQRVSHAARKDDMSPSTFLPR